MHSRYPANFQAPRGAEDPDEVQLKIIFDAEGKKLAQPLPRKLSGAQAQQIVTEVDPFLKGIEVTDYFD